MMIERRQKVIAALVLVAVFLLGAFVGTHVARYGTHKHINAMLHGSEEEVETRLVMTVLDQRLRLTAAEHTTILSVIEKHAADHSRLREQIEPALVALRAEERAEIRAVLPADKQAKFDSLIDKLDERRKRVVRALEH